MTTEGVKVLIIHVRSAKEREAFIETQMKKVGLPYEYVLDGDVDDLTPDVLDRYFANDGAMDTMHGKFSRTSCAYKHFLAVSYILEHDLPGAVVIEDDLRLFSGFKEVFLRSIKELSAGEAAIVNYEESSLMLVPRSRRRKGQLLYRASRDRFAGCLYITREAARVVVDTIAKEKISVQSDTLHRVLTERGLIHYYWSHPCLACQCSCDGTMPTMIPTRPRPFKHMKWLYKRQYKRLLYWLR